MSQLTHIGQAGKPVPLAALSHWLRIMAHGHMATGCRVLAARDPLAAVRLPCLHHATRYRVPLAAVRLRIEAPGRADGDRATLTEPSRTIFYFFKLHK